MRKLLLIAVALAVVVGTTTTALAKPRFQVRCFSSHVAAVDPIVSPGVRPSDHEHEFFGNTTTDADSTYASMVAGDTNCSTVADTAGYWTPTLFRENGEPVRAQSLLIYYRGSDDGPTVAFPPDLRIVSDDFVIGPDRSNIIVKFPSCWDGRRTDSPDHRSHMAFTEGGDCPATHPVRVPAITEVFRYPVASVQGFTLSSGGFATGHADFWNTWDQAALVDVVNRCLQPRQGCVRIDA